MTVPPNDAQVEQQVEQRADHPAGRKLDDTALARVAGGAGGQTQAFLSQTLKKGIYKLTHPKSR